MDNEQLKTIGYHVFAFVMLLIFLNAFISNYQDYVEVKAIDDARVPASTEIFEKTAVQGLFSKMRYYAHVQHGLEDYPTTVLGQGELFRLSKKQFDELQVGDTINGVMADGKFIRESDTIGDYWTYYIGFTLFMMYVVAYICYYIRRLKPIEWLIDKVFIPVCAFGLVSIMAGLLLFSLYSFGGTVKDGFDRLIKSNQYIETAAAVTAGDADVRYGRYEGSYYHLALAFEDQHGEKIRLTKEVTRHTYDSYVWRSEIPISYNPDNPYHVYILDIGGADIFQLLFTSSMFIYYATIFVTVLLIYAGILMYKQKKKKVGN